MDEIEPSATDIETLARLIDEGQLSARQVIGDAVARADSFDRTLGVFITRTSESAVAEALAVDERRTNARSVVGPLEGMPIGVKDILLTAQAPTTAGSVVRGPRDGGDQYRDAQAVAQLRAGGAIVVGKANTAEFAVGTPDPSKPFPLARNPWSLRHWAGGSSSGSASGVASGMFVAALGTDTGGSIRIPSAFCGVTGLKPTFGLVSTDGCIPLSDSLDHVGPMARTAADCAILMDALTSPIEESRSGGTGRFVESLTQPISGLRIGMDDLLRFSGPVTDPELEGVLRTAAAQFSALGAPVEQVELPLYNEVTTATWTVLAAEAHLNHEPDLAQCWRDYGLGTRIFLASGFLHSLGAYLRAQRIRQLAHALLREMLRTVDVIITPTASFTAPALDGPGETPAPLDFRGIHTGYWSGLGYPAVSVPAGIGANGLPLGIQIVGRPYDDAKVLAVAHAFQTATTWHRRAPNPSALQAGRSEETQSSGSEELSGAQAEVSVLATPVDSHGSDDDRLVADLQRLLDAQRLTPSPIERAALLLALSHARSADETLTAISGAGGQPLPNLCLQQPQRHQ